jgi:hypothetical protein
MRRDILTLTAHGMTLAEVGKCSSTIQLLAEPAIRTSAGPDSLPRLSYREKQQATAPVRLHRPSSAHTRVM